MVIANIMTKKLRNGPSILLEMEGLKTGYRYSLVRIYFFDFGSNSGPNSSYECIFYQLKIDPIDWPCFLAFKPLKDLPLYAKKSISEPALDVQEKDRKRLLYKAQNGVLMYFNPRS